MAWMTSLRNSWLVGQRDSGKDRGSLQKEGGGGDEAYDAREKRRRQAEIKRIEREGQT